MCNGNVIIILTLNIIREKTKKDYNLDMDMDVGLCVA